MTTRGQILMLARRLTRTYREIGEAVGVTRQRAHEVVHKFAPALAAARARQPAETVTLTCEQCGETFTLPEHKSRHRRFCSRRCLGLAMLDEESYGARAYWLRRNLGLTWLVVADRLGMPSEQRALQSARMYARRRGFPWPLRRAR